MVYWQYTKFCCAQSLSSDNTNDQDTSCFYVLNQFYQRKQLPLILMQLQITNICSVHIAALYLIYETSQWNTYDQKTQWWN